MSNPFSGSEIPGMNAMGDTLSFVKKLWGNMQVPGMVAPPMSVDELDKKIQDLKTVESWLTVNMNMLRGTIQALEVQRATLAALQSIGESFAQHAQQAGAMAEQASSPSTSFAASASSSNSNADWPMHPHTAKAKVAEPDPDDEVDEESADMPPEAGASAVAAEVPVEELTQSTKTNNATNTANATKEADSADTSTPFVNPAAWWGLLQEQFKQAVSKAMEGEQVSSTTAEAAPVQKPAGKSTAGTATKTAKAGASAKVKPVNKAGSKSVASSATKPAAKTAAKPKAAAKPLAKGSKTTKAR
ncbi:PhaM family polyhydroxyalkanoate granule multifunctional regulatory protein [Undibacterium sp. Ji83W]|uniref:PhaM family polyhydroxyalkanoate granule multifunctional regulatory protein n=1 Tax=Undibacterium sp. Ji83W TaxID=3413043 RepID=UPI003BF39625